jgi:hypothetical protein
LVSLLRGTVVSPWDPRHRHRVPPLPRCRAGVSTPRRRQPSMLRKRAAPPPLDRDVIGHGEGNTESTAAAASLQCGARGSNLERVRDDARRAPQVAFLKAEPRAVRLGELPVPAPATMLKTVAVFMEHVAVAMLGKRSHASLFRASRALLPSQRCRRRVRPFRLNQVAHIVTDRFDAGELFELCPVAALFLFLQQSCRMVTLGFIPRTIDQPWGRPSASRRPFFICLRADRGVVDHWFEERGILESSRLAGCPRQVRVVPILLQKWAIEVNSQLRPVA